MATLKEELEHGVLSKVAEDEPIFVLRARDKLAPGIVRKWIVYARAMGVNEEKLKEAWALVNHMGDWARDNADGGRLPD